MDVFFSAAREDMDGLEKAGLLVSATRRDLLSNSVVLVGDKTLPRRGPCRAAGAPCPDQPACDRRSGRGSCRALRGAGPEVSRSVFHRREEARPGRERPGGPPVRRIRFRGARRGLSDGRDDVQARLDSRQRSIGFPKMPSRPLSLSDRGPVVLQVQEKAALFLRLPEDPGAQAAFKAAGFDTL